MTRTPFPHHLTRADGRLTPDAEKWLNTVVPAEGAWTPVLGGSAGATGQVFSTQWGRYVKIGPLVRAWFGVQLSTLGTITGSVQIEGLPFASRADTDARSVGPVIWGGLTTAMTTITGRLRPSSTTIDLLALAAAGTSLGTLSQADLSSVTVFSGSLEYLVDL